MFFLTWNHFEKDNKVLKKKLGVDHGEVIDLQFKSGFFICPDDYVNRKSHLPKVVLHRSIIDLMNKKYRKIVGDTERFLQLTEGFDRMNSEHFKKAVKLVFFFGAASYAYHKKLADLESLKHLYRPRHREKIQSHLAKYTYTFLELAHERHQHRNLYALFQFAISLVQKVTPKVKIPKEFRSVSAFLRSFKYSPISNLLGSAFEEEMQELFEEMEKKEESQLSKLIYAHVRDKGVMIPLDTDEQFKKLATNEARGVSVPDYIYVTKNYIAPIDLKVNLSFTKEKQIDPQNLRLLFEKTAARISVIFKDLTIEGELIEPVKEEKKLRKAEKKAVTPMQVLKQKGVRGKDLGVIAQLWKEGKSVTQERLHSRGLQHEDLGLVANVFNDMLKKR